jgi:hypothetical protein
MFKEIQRTTLQKKVCGAGINDAWYKVRYKEDGVTYNCPFYITWKSMIVRCYSTKNQERQPTYKNIMIYPPWLVFSVFRTWMMCQDWEGKHLDKDLLIPGNKVYGPDTCIFVSGTLNSLFANCHKVRDYPTGVTKSVVKGRVYFQARCCEYGKACNIGNFKNPKEASIAYQEAKQKYIIELASQVTDMRLRAGLLQHASIC